MAAPISSHSCAMNTATLVRCLTKSTQRLQVSSSSQRILVPKTTQRRRTFVSSTVRCRSDSSTGNDATPARTHRFNSPRTAGGPDVDHMTGEAKNSSTATFAAQRQANAQGLADLTQSIARRQQDTGQTGGPLDGLFSNTPLRTALGATMPLETDPVEEEDLLPLAPSGYSNRIVPMKHEPILQALINNIMRDGKKASATRHVLEMLRYLGRVFHADPIPAVKEAIRSASPLVRMQTRKEGGKNTQVPLVLFPRQARRRGILAILEASKDRKESRLHLRLGKEILAVLEGKSAALTRKTETHKLALVNRGNLNTRV